MRIKIICGQLEVTPGRPDINFIGILEFIKQAKERCADLLLLPEMCLSGYLIGDLWEQDDFLKDCEYYGEQIAAQTCGCNLTVIFGNVAVDWEKTGEDGRPRKYNAAFAAAKGRLLPGYADRPYVIKNSLPNYREFDDCRYFYSLQKLCAEENLSIGEVLQPLALNLRGETIKAGVLLCEDGWTENYAVNVPQALAENGAQLLCNLSCSPYTLGKNNKRSRLFSAQAKKAQTPLIYCNNVGVQNNGKNIFTFDGCSCAYNADGSLTASAPVFEQAALELTYDTASEAINGTHQAHCPAKTGSEAIYLALRYGMQKFLAQCGVSKITVGLSGGIDSAVTAAMYADILGADNVLLLNLPSRYNSAATQNLAARLAHNLNAPYAVLPISQSCALTEAQLTQTPVRKADGETFYLKLSGLVKENIQARDRGARLIAAAAAAFGGAFSCNSNKAEIAVGYATFYGDICGIVAMLGDLWKHQVYALGRYLNEQVFRREVIPEEIFSIRPSAELSAAQTVGAGGDPLVYPYHDYLLRAFVENWRKTSPADILRWYKEGALAEKLGCDAKIIEATFPTAQNFIEDLERWWKLFAGFAVAKRIQAPPVLAISRRAFGYDYREAQLTPYFSREYYQLKEELLTIK